VARFSKGLRDALAEVKTTGRIEGVTPPAEVEDDVNDDAEVQADAELASEADLDGDLVIEFDSRAWHFIRSQRKDMIVLRIIEDLTDRAMAEGLTPDYVAEIQRAMAGWGAEDWEIDGVLGVAARRNQPEAGKSVVA